MALPEKLITTLEPCPRNDPWLELFSTPDIQPSLLMDMLRSGAVSPDYRDEKGTTLLDAVVSTFKHIKSTSESDQSIPMTPDGDWGRLGGVSVSIDTIIGILIGCNKKPFETPQKHHEVLTVALQQGWTQLAIRCLKDENCPDSETLNQWDSNLSCYEENRPLPWLHALALKKRHHVLDAWMQRPGMDSNFSDSAGRTALFYAKDEKTVACLLKAGVDVNHVAHDGRNAFETWTCFKQRIKGFDVTDDTLQNMGRLLEKRGLKHSISHKMEALVKTQNASDLIGDIPAEELQNIRLVRGNHQQHIEWGIIGFLAWAWFQNRSHEEKENIAGAKEVVHVLTYLNDIGLPDKAWIHESIPGVADITLVKVFIESCLSNIITSAMAMPVVEKINSFQRASDREKLQAEKHLMTFVTGHKKRELKIRAEETLISYLKKQTIQHEATSEIILTTLKDLISDNTMRTLVGKVIMDRNQRWKSTDVSNTIIKNTLLKNTSLSDEDKSLWIETLLIGTVQVCLNWEKTFANMPLPITSENIHIDMLCELIENGYLPDETQLETTLSHVERVMREDVGKLQSSLNYVRMEKALPRLKTTNKKRL